MRRLPDHQLSLFHGYRPDVLQVNTCDVDGCDVRHGGTGPCINHLAERLRALHAKAEALGVTPGLQDAAPDANQKAGSSNG